MGRSAWKILDKTLRRPPSSRPDSARRGPASFGESAAGVALIFLWSFKPSEPHLSAYLKARAMSHVSNELGYFS